ncbi:MAG: hypothetical protein ACK52I_16205, partial [Pseudomonadota bacterium]
MVSGAERERQPGAGGGGALGQQHVFAALPGRRPEGGARGRPIGGGGRQGADDGEVLFDERPDFAPVRRRRAEGGGEAQGGGVVAGVQPPDDL